MATTAKDRAEELLHKLQKRAKELLEAQDGVVQTVRDLVEDKGLAPAEVKKRLEDVLGKLAANSLWERLRTSDAVVALSDYRDEIERRVEDKVHKLLGNLQLVTKADLRELEGEVASLKKKLENIKKQVSKAN